LYTMAYIICRTMPSFRALICSSLRGSFLSKAYFLRFSRVQRGILNSCPPILPPLPYDLVYLFNYVSCQQVIKGVCQGKFLLTLVFQPKRSSFFGGNLTLPSICEYHSSILSSTSVTPWMGTLFSFAKARR